MKRLRSRALGAGLLSGSVLLLLSTTVVNLGNYLFNLSMGRWLGPAAFADLSLLVTLMLMITLVTATVQTVVAKFGATYAVEGASERLAGLRRWGGRWSWMLGTGLGTALVIGAPLLQTFFHTASPLPFILLGVGTPFYFAQGVDRGLLQGRMRFGLLAISYQAEMWSRLAIGVLLVAAGFGVSGAVGALGLSFVATWWVARRARLALPLSGQLETRERRAALAFSLPVALALVGQILINNSDVILVKRFFAPTEAGHYAALALIGRIVFFATWSVVTVLLPVVAQRHQRGERHSHLLWLSLAAVLLVSMGVTGVSYLYPTQIVGLLFGSAYLSIAPLLWLYAIATALYALANVIITYRLSTGNGWGSLFAVAAGLTQVGTLWMVHGSLAQVVHLQIVIMSGLLGALLGWELWQRRQAIVAIGRARTIEPLLRFKPAAHG